MNTMFEEVGLDVVHLYSGDDLMQRSKVFCLINKYQEYSIVQTVINLDLPQSSISC